MKVTFYLKLSSERFGAAVRYGDVYSSVLSPLLRRTKVDPCQTISSAF